MDSASENVLHHLVSSSLTIGGGWRPRANEVLRMVSRQCRVYYEEYYCHYSQLVVAFLSLWSGQCSELSPVTGTTRSSTSPTSSLPAHGPGRHQVSAPPLLLLLLVKVRPQVQSSLPTVFHRPEADLRCEDPSLRDRRQVRDQ